MSLRGSAAIVGIGELQPMKKPPPGRRGWGLMVEVSRMAIEDAGLRKQDIDGILTESPMDEPMMMLGSSLLAEYLDIPISYAGTAGIAGASGAGMVWRAAAAIHAGLCNTVLCVIGDVMDPVRFLAMMGALPLGPPAQYEDPYGPMGANSGYALAATRHAYEYGTTDAQRARVAVDQRTNACANPDAIFYGRPITVDDVLNSRVVCSPLHMLEIVMPVSGAAAVIVTSAERPRALRHPPVYLLGAHEHFTHMTESEAPRLTTSSIKVAANKAFQMAGYGPRDVDFVSVYDCFTITVMITLEDAGFCPKGESGPFCEETDMTYKGKLPVNTHGGQLSFGQAGLAGGMSHVTEAARQLMGRAGENQVKKHDLVYVNGNGGILSEQCSLVLGTAATL